MTLFIVFLIILTSGWGLFLKKKWMNPRRGFVFIFSSLFYFSAVFISYTFMAGGKF